MIPHVQSSSAPTDPVAMPESPTQPIRQFPGKRACVIGAGIAGLALAIRLQAAGIATVLIEARDKPGGQAYAWERDGFVFNAGPATLADPAALRELWDLTGHDMAQDIDLLPVMPFCRFNWPDGTHFDLSNDEAALTREIARISPVDLAGYEDYARYAQTVHQEGGERLSQTPFLSLAEMARAMPALIRLQGWRSLYSIISSFIRDERLREAFSFQSLRSGGNPLTTSAIAAAKHLTEQQGGNWWPQGGNNRLAMALATRFEQLGGTLRLHDPVVHVHTLGNRVSEVETQSGWKERFDAVASNADLVHTYRDLLSGSQRGPEMARKLARRDFSPSLFVVHFALEGSWPGIPHNMVLFGPRFSGLLHDIYAYGVLPHDFTIMLQHPSVTDPDLAPEGKSVFQASILVANRGKLPIDWEAVGPLLERRILDEIGRRLVPDIHDRIVSKFHYSPRDFSLDLNAHLGSVWSLEPTRTQSWWLRPHNRDDKLANFYLVGSGTHPGGDIPGVLAGAKLTAKLMLEDLR